MTSPNQIVSLSGGKDSTAMLLMMLDRGEPIHSVAFCDTGWEFPQMLGHVALLEERTGVVVTRLRPARPFTYWMYERPIVARKGPMKGKVHRIGNGWPSMTRRWCTRLKLNAIDRHLKTIPDPVVCIGYAADERHRVNSFSLHHRKYHEIRYPLVEWGVTEADALAYCRERGYHWDGLYDVFGRVSCFCCPLQSLAELRKVRRHFPDLWTQMLDMDRRIPGHNYGFYHYATVEDLDRRFAEEDRQGVLMPEATT